MVQKSQTTNHRLDGAKNARKYIMGYFTISTGHRRNFFHEQYVPEIPFEVINPADRHILWWKEMLELQRMSSMRLDGTGCFFLNLNLYHRPPKTNGWNLEMQSTNHQF